MKELYIGKWGILIGVFLCSIGCTSDDEPSPVRESGILGTPIDGMRIAWDYSSMSAIAPTGDHLRICELSDGSLLAAYATNGACHVRMSPDGREWRYDTQVFTGGYSEPSVLCLDDGRICMVAVYEDATGISSLQITESLDNGFSWSAPQTIYTASETSTPCSGPALLQLPDGSLQCYFASAEHHLPDLGIWMSASSDRTSWSQPESCSYTSGHSESCVSPVLCADRIILAFESVASDGATQVQTLSKPIAAAWSTAERQDIMFDNGTFGTNYRKPHMISYGKKLLLCVEKHNESRVLQVVWKEAESWMNPTEPFSFQKSQEVTDGSLVVLSDGTFLATGHTIPSGSSAQPHVIRGYALSELRALPGTINLDGAVTEEEWGVTMPLFIGHQGPTRMQASFRHDRGTLYIGAKVWDSTQISGLPGIKDNYTINGKGIDGVTLYLDPFGTCYETPVSGMYKLITVPDGGYAWMEYREGMWNRCYDTDGIEVRTQQLQDCYFVEMALSLSALDKSALSPLRLTLGLNASDGSVKYEEMAALSTNGQPNTWYNLAFE